MEEGEDLEQLIRLLAAPPELRTSEDVFEIANGLFRASFVRQLDVVTRSSIAKCVELYRIGSGAHVYLSEKNENPLYIVLSGSIKIEGTELEFLAGDTFGFRTSTSPTFQVMMDHRVVTCTKMAVSAKISFRDCLETWPESTNQNVDNSGASLRKRLTDPSFDLVWSPELAKSILLRGTGDGEEVLVALEFLNFPPINGYSKELREILVSKFLMLRKNSGGVFREWINLLPIDPNDIRLSRVHCDSVVVVVSGSVKATCTRGKKDDASMRADMLASTAVSITGATESSTTGEGKTDRVSGDQFIMMHLKRGDVFPPQSGQMQGGRHCRDDADFTQDVGDEWSDFTRCALVAESPSTEVLIVGAHIFNDVIYPGTDLRYSMETVREILGKPPGLRTSREIGYIARNVLSHHVAFHQMSALALERIASRLTDRVASGGQVLVEDGEKVDFFTLLLTGSASIISTSKAAKSRSQARRMKVGRLEPGDLWGMQHMQAGSEAGFEILAVETCEVIYGRVEEVRAAEKRDCTQRPVGAKTMRSLRVPPERRTRVDIRNIVAEMSTPKSGLDIAQFRHIPACLKARIAAALRLKVWPPFLELRRDVDDASTYLVIVKGSISLQTMTKSHRFNMDTLDMPETGPLKMFDVDNAMALEDWRASGLGPCAAMLFERQILGEFPHAEEAVLSMRAVTRQETTAVVVDPELYDKQLNRVDPSDSHAAICREVLSQLKHGPEKQTGVGRLESDLLLRLAGANRVLKQFNTSCRLRLNGSFGLKRYGPGEVVTDAEEFGNNLFIILEGRLEYSVQTIHRGVVDRELAKEVGLVPGLRCIGVMTSGDYFAPESMMGRGNRRPRAVAAGSYRIRCSPDASTGGAMCLVLPRQTIEDAVRRAHEVQASLANRHLLQIAGLSNGVGRSPTVRAASAHPTIHFGGPERNNHFSAAEGEGGREGTCGGVTGRGKDVEREKDISGLEMPLSVGIAPPPALLEGPRTDRASLNEQSRGSSQSPGERTPPAEYSTVTSSIGCTATVSDEGVPSPTYTAKRNQGVGRGDCSYPNIPPTTGTTAAAITTAGTESMETTGIGQAFITGVPTPNTSGVGSETAARQARFSPDASQDPSNTSLVEAEAVDALSYCDIAGSRTRRKYSAEDVVGSADDSLGWGAVDRSAGSKSFDSGGNRGKEGCCRRWSDEGRFYAESQAALIDGERKEGGGGGDGGGGDVLLEVLRSFVSVHVVPHKVQSAPRVSPRENITGSLVTDELTLLGMISGSSRAPSRGEKRRVSDDGAFVLQPTPLCCRQVILPVTFGCGGSSSCGNGGVGAGGSIGGTGVGGSGLAGGAGGINTMASIRLAIAKDNRRARSAMLEAANTAGTSATVVSVPERGGTGERRIGRKGSPSTGLNAGTKDTATLAAATGTRKGLECQRIVNDYNDHARWGRRGRDMPVTAYGSGGSPDDSSDRHRQGIRWDEGGGSGNGGCSQRSAKDTGKQQRDSPFHVCRAGRPATRPTCGNNKQEGRQKEGVPHAPASRRPSSVTSPRTRLATPRVKTAGGRMDTSGPRGGKLEADTPWPPRRIDSYQGGNFIGGGGRDTSVVYHRRRPRSYASGQGRQASLHHDGGRDFIAENMKYLSSQGGTGGDTSKTMGRVPLVLPGAVAMLEGALPPASENEGNSRTSCIGRNASPPKQPAKVRRLRMTLQELNDLNAL